MASKKTTPRERLDSLYAKYPPEEQAQWSRLISHAWKDKEMFKRLRDDPKKEIERLKGLKETDKGYIGDLSLIGGTKGTSGYNGLPEIPDELEKLSQKELEDFLFEYKGIFGIMQLCCM